MRTPITTNAIHTPRNGSATSSQPVTSRQASSMSGQLSMFDLMNLPNSSNATSSLVSAAGPTLCVLQGGLTADQSGPEAAPVSRSRSQARKRASTTSATSGLSGESLSPSDDLQRSLENRLRARLNGSDLCEVIWKPWATPWGQCLSKPRARVRTTSETGFGLWPTPTSRDHKDGKYCPNVPINGLLGRTVWPTPTASADKSIRTPEGARKEVERGRSPDLAAHAMAMWPTPTSLAPARNGNNEAGNSAGLVAIRKHALWATPCAQPANGTPEAFLERKRRSVARGSSMGVSLTDLQMQAHPPLNGSSERTEKPGALNPAFVCWLMGYPPEWDACAPTAMPSSRKSRRNS